MPETPIDHPAGHDAGDGSAHQTDSRDPLTDQPIARVSRDGVDYVLLGTAHVSRASVDAVRALAERESFDAIAVELCDARAQAMRDPDAINRLDLFQVIREGKAGLVAANLALSSFQRRLAEQFGIEPGAEMRAAMDAAEAEATPVWLIDREVGTTLKRCYRSVGFWKKCAIIGGLGASLFEDDTVSEEDVEKLKQGDLLEGAFSEFARESEPLYRALISERDRYMAAQLRRHAQQGETPGRVLAVVGAGHLAGIEHELADNHGEPDATIQELNTIPPASPWPKWIGYALIALILAGFFVAFSRGASVGADAIIGWVLATGIGGAIGATLAGAHPLSILAAFVASPITPFHPVLASGMVAAAVEAWLRRPRVADFGRIREDVQHWRGWWRNRVTRTLLVFMLTNLGTSLGVWLGGARLLKAIFA